MNCQQLIEETKATEELLKEFGLELLGTDPGVMVSFEGYTMFFNGMEWKWLKPLLLELKQNRGKNGKAENCRRSS